MDGKSLNPLEIKLQELKKLFPEAFTEDKIDWEKLKATLGENVNFSNERYVLNWAGKSDAFRSLQTPTTKTLIPARDESVNFDETENIFIEGENLEVLKALQKSYFGKVKMIYIDPPYNTGNDTFIYPDKFSETKEEYKKRIGDKDAEGTMTKEGLVRKNSKDNGQYHSNWLNMMYPRLFLAKNLLKEDGVIYISIGDEECYNLGLLCNEIFGEENLVGHIVWQKKYSPQNDAKYFSDSHEHILCYAKNKEKFNIGLLPRTEKANARYKNPDKDPRGDWKSSDLTRQEFRERDYYEIESPKTGKKFLPPKGNSWGRPKKIVEKLIKENRIYFGPDGNSVPSLKRFLSEVKQGITPQTLWFREDVGDTQEGKKEIKSVFGDVSIFETPKPTRLIRRAILTANMEQNDIILDFFAGSASTATAVINENKNSNKNLKFIVIQLPELTGKKTAQFKAGYKTIADIAKERISRAAKKIKVELSDENEKKKGELEFEKKETKELDLGFKVLKLADSNFKQWQQLSAKDSKALEEQLKIFVDPVAKNAKTENMVYELLLKSGKDLNSKVEKKDGYYLINDSELVFILEQAIQAIIDEVLKLKPQKVIALDRIFKDNDQLKTNTALQMKDAGIEFKTI